MTTGHQMSMAGAKTRFFLGLGILIALFCHSALRREPVAGYEVVILLSLIIAAMLFDYLKVSQFLSVLRSRRETGCSHDRAVRAALNATLKSRLLVRLLGTELITLYYAFFAKYDRVGAHSGTRQFSYTKSSNASDVFLFVALSQLPFLPFIHILLEHKKGPGVAWVITLLTLWSVIWYLAQVEAVRFRPVELTEGLLRYRFGLFWTADIPVDEIRSARCIGVTEELDGRGLFVSPMGSTKNVLLKFRAPVRFRGPYSLSTRKRNAAISVDNPGRLLSELALEGVDIDTPGIASRGSR